MESDKNRMIRIKNILLIVFLVATTFSCSSRKGVPYSEPLAYSEELEEGKILFDTYCNSCHPQGSGGLGPAINNKPLPKFMIRFQSRHGLGVMPEFKDEVITDEQLKDIASYLVYLRKEG